MSLSEIGVTAVTVEMTVAARARLWTIDENIASGKYCEYSLPHPHDKTIDGLYKCGVDGTT